MMHTLRLASLSLVTSTLLLGFGCATEDVAPEAAPEEEAEDELSKAVPAVDDVKITVLSDMVVSSGTVAEWGFSAFVEITKGTTKTNILFDTGASERTISNAEKLGVDICSANDVVLSHNHGDHTSGLVAIRNHCKTKNPHAAERAHVGGQEIFWPRLTPKLVDDNVMTTVKGQYEAAGGTFVVDDALTKLANIPGVWTSGKITRTYNEKVHPTDVPMTKPDGSKVEDFMPEEQALIINTKKGLVVITGCGHAGLTNTVEHARAATKRTKVFALMGGLHLLAKADGTVNDVGTMAWQVNNLKKYKPTLILGAHCTGFERLVYMREKLKIADKDASISTIGAQLTLDGIVHGRLAGPVQ